MENLSHKQKIVLDKLLPPLRKTLPEKELKRLCKVFRELIENSDDDYLFENFCITIESNLFRVLKNRPEFYSLDFFQRDYADLLKDYIDIDENNFIEQYIDSQNQIISKTYKFLVSFNINDSLEVMKFVSDEFYKEFEHSARAKIKFLEGKLNNVINPFPLLFTSAKVYTNFMTYTSKHIIDFYTDYSYLKKRLLVKKLIYPIKDNDFMKIIHDDMGLLKPNEYQKYLIKNKLTALTKCTSASRENNFNNIFLS